MSKKADKNKIKGICVIKVDRILFHPDNSKLGTIEIDIFSIISFHSIKSYKIGDPPLVKLKTSSETFIFSGWHNAVQQFFFAYLTKEVIFSYQ